jgi:hypothetical protein
MSFSVLMSVAEPHHCYAALAPSKSFNAAPAPSLPNTKPTLLPQTQPGLGQFTVYFDLL